MAVFWFVENRSPPAASKQQALNYSAGGPSMSSASFASGASREQLFLHVVQRTKMKRRHISCVDSSRARIILGRTDV
jgi:hypothetical protein